MTVTHKHVCTPQAMSLPDVRKPKMNFINADMFYTMPVKQSETRALVLSDGSTLSMILPARTSSGLPTQHHVMKWDRVSGLNSKSQIFNCFISWSLSQQQAEDSIISIRQCLEEWSASYRMNINQVRCLRSLIDERPLGKMSQDD